MTRDPLNVASVDKAFRVLHAFGNAAGDLSLGDIAEISGLDKSAAQRFAHTLWQLGYLHKNDKTRRFSLGSKVLDLAFFFLKSNALVEAATPALVELRRACGERVYLSLFDDTSIIYAIRQQSKREYFYSSLIGRRMPTFCTAGGRAILARLPREKAADIVSRSELKPLTPKTITDAAVIIQKVDQARLDGFALAMEESSIGELTLGVAVLDSEGIPVAAIHIGGSLSEWQPDEFARKFAPLVMETAQSLSRARPPQAVYDVTTS
ncbi:IclR family transcriptional regulator [Cupriavidus sp. CuC1]|uniref:IclR family transcriptional regulator n=1 Tax=Cupriavidus sp. CuC1 TaxID=3373131 RepID=UPI0037D0168A